MCETDQSLKTLCGFPRQPTKEETRIFGEVRQQPCSLVGEWMRSHPLNSGLWVPGVMVDINATLPSLKLLQPVLLWERALVCWLFNCYFSPPLSHIHTRIRSCRGTMLNWHRHLWVLVRVVRKVTLNPIHLLFQPEVCLLSRGRGVGLLLKFQLFSNYAYCSFHSDLSFSAV